MKRLLIIVLPIFLLLFCTACGKNTTPAVTAENGYSCKAVCDYNNMQIKADVFVGGASCLTVNITEPETVSGMQFNYENGSSIITFSGIKYDITDKDDAAGIGPVLKAVLGDISSGMTLKQQKNRPTVYGSYNGCKYALQFNEQGLIEKLTVDKYNFTATFSDWKY